jgi:hypothetical protein
MLFREQDHRPRWKILETTGHSIMKIARQSATLLIFAASVSQAQTGRLDTSTVTLAIAAPSPRVNIGLQGDVILHSWNEPRIEVRATDETTGRVLGYSNQKARGAYAVTIRSADSGIVIIPRERPAPVAIGYSSVKDRQQHDVYLPSTARVCVSAGYSSLEVRGTFDLLEVRRDGISPRLRVERDAINPPLNSACQRSR